jgi:chromosome segregation ATPase
MPPFPEGELSAMAKMVGDNGRLLLPPKGEKESKEDYQARLSKTYDQAEQRLGALRKYLDSCKNEFGEINERLGLVSGKLRALEGEFAKLAGDYAARIPEAVSSRTDFSELLALLRLAREKYTLISEAVSDPGAALDELFAELTGPLSAEPLSKEMKTAVSSCFKEASNKPIGQVIGTIGANSLFRVMNKINQKNFEIKKEEEREDKIKEVRTEEKHRSRIMAQIKKEAEAAEKARPNKKGK